MRPYRTWIGVVAFGWMSFARADGAAGLVCLPPGEVREIVAAKSVVAPASAMVTARRAVPDADVVRANLCRNGGALVYVITALRKDGRVVKVVIDAPSGDLHGVQ